MSDKGNGLTTPTPDRSALILGYLARAEDLADNGEAWQALQELWVARNSNRDPALLPTILEKVNGMSLSGALDRDRFVDDEVATSASESVSSLRSAIERDIELARMGRAHRALREAPEAGCRLCFFCCLRSSSPPFTRRCSSLRLLNACGACSDGLSQVARVFWADSRDGLRTRSSVEPV